MAYAGESAMVQGLTWRINLLQNERLDISNTLLEASRQGSNLAKDKNAAKNAVRGMYDADSAAYEVAMDQIEEEYEFNIAKIAAWENELDQRANAIEVESKASTELRDQHKAILKENIKQDHKLL